MTLPAPSPAGPSDGEFPFCFRDRSDRGDTPAVTQWRNRSSYLTRGKLSTFATAIYLYNRGMFGNLVVLSLPIIAAALLLSCFYPFFRHNPFLITLILLACLLACHVADFVAHQNRPVREWTFLRALRQGLLYALALAVAVEATPQCVELVRQLRPSGTLGIPHLVAFLGAAASANTLFRFLAPHPWQSRLAGRVALGTFSWLLIAIILVGIVDYLYFGIPPYGWFLFIPFLAAGAGAASVAVGMLCHWPSTARPSHVRHAAATASPPHSAAPVTSDGWRASRPWARSALFFGIATVGSVLATSWCLESYSLWSRYGAQSVAEITRPLARLARSLETRNTDPADALPQEASDLLARLDDQRHRLDAEGNREWSQEYEDLFMGGFFPSAHSLLTRYVLRPSANTPLYRALDKAALFNEWSFLGPLRPRYHQHAVSFLNSCAAIDQLDADTRQMLLTHVSQRCVKRLADSLADADADREASQALHRRSLLAALLVKRLTGSFLADNADGQVRFVPGSLSPLLEAHALRDPQRMDATVASLFGHDEVGRSLAFATLAPGEKASYEELLGAMPRGAAQAGAAPPAALAPASLRLRLHQEAIQLETNQLLRYEILVEALLASLCRLHHSTVPAGTGQIEEILAAIPGDRFNESLFGPGKSLVRRWTDLMNVPAEDLAMTAAGFARRPVLSPPPEAFEPDQYVADAFRQTVCSAIDRPAGLVRAAAFPTYCAATANAGGADRTPAAETSTVEKRLAQMILFYRATLAPTLAPQATRDARAILGELHHPGTPTSHRFREILHENDLIMAAIHRRTVNGSTRRLLPEIRMRLLGHRLMHDENDSTQDVDKAVRVVGAGRYGNLDNLQSMVEDIAKRTFWIKFVLVLTVALAMACFGWAFIDPNMTSIHRFYRDSLGSAFLMAEDKGVIVERSDVKLSHLAGDSPAPYPLINAALNTSSRDHESIRERNALPFLFSPLYVGGHFASSAGDCYVPTTEFEAHNPAITAASAMTISGGAASPLMGRYTNWALRLPMVLTNLRLGYWIREPRAPGDTDRRTPLADVIASEREAISGRRRLALDDAAADVGGADAANVLGLAFSGGGIRSAALNFGIAQGLFRHDVWKFVDYLSTVSGGGYTGTSISIFMRGGGGAQSLPGGSVKSEGMQAADGGEAVTSHASRTSAANQPAQAPTCGCLFKEVVAAWPFPRGWVNVSDGGHFENLAVYALLQRRCPLIIAGDGEADPHGVLDGLSRLSMLAQVDLGIRLEFPDGDLRRIVAAQDGRPRHFTIAKIHYRDGRTGWLVYLRSSLTGDEDEFISSYKARFSDFPHQSTTDQFFTEEQFEAYRRLGEHIVEAAVTEVFGGFALASHDDLVAAAERFFRASARTPTAASPRSPAMT